MNEDLQPTRRRAWTRVLPVLPLVAVALGLSLWLLNRPRVLWKGKPAEYWIGRLSFYDRNSGSPSAEEFLFAAGPEVMPELIGGLRRRDSWIHDKWVETYFKLGKWQHYFELPTKRSQYRANCAQGLAALGVPNALAEAELFQALHDPDEWVRSAAVHALSRIAVDKEKVVPALVTGLQSTNSNHRLACIFALIRLLPGSIQAGDALRQEAGDPDFNVRASIGGALGRDDTAPTKSFAVISRLLHDPHPTVRDRAAQGLGKLKYAPEAKTHELVRALETELTRPDRNEIVIWKIEGALAEIGPIAAAAVPALSSLVTATNASQTFAIIALSEIRPQEQRWEQMLIEKLSDPSVDFFAVRELARRRTAAALPTLRKLSTEARDLSVRHMAALGVWHIEPALPDPFVPLSGFLSTDTTSGKFELVEFLGELGSDARPVIPALQSLRYCHSEMMRDYAEAALAKIDREYLTDPWKDYPRSARLEELK